LPTPDLIISITGGAKRFELPARLRKAFHLGLVSAAATTSKSEYIFKTLINYFHRCMDNYNGYKCWCC
jgi:hypothetical protein